VALRFATSSPRRRASAPESMLARRAAEMPVRFLAAVGSRDGLRAVLSCVAGIWTMKVDLAATMMTMLRAQQRESQEWGEQGGQEEVMEWATCSSYPSRMYG